MHQILIKSAGYTSRTWFGWYIPVEKMYGPVHAVEGLFARYGKADRRPQSVDDQGIVVT
jgi:hypothetical protein